MSNYKTKFSAAWKILSKIFNTIIYRFISYDWQFAMLVSKYIDLVWMRVSIILCTDDDVEDNVSAATDEEK